MSGPRQLTGSEFRTRTYRRTLRKVRVLNSLPVSWRGPLIGFYNTLAWRIAKKGL